MNTKAQFRFDHTKLVEGALFYEQFGHRLVQYRVVKPFKLKPGYEDRPSIEWEAVKVSDVNQEPIHFLITQGLEHYGPEIYLKDEVVEVNGGLFTTR